MNKKFLVVSGLLLIIVFFGLGYLLVGGYGTDLENGLVTQIPLPFNWGEVILPLSQKKLSTNQTAFNDASRPKVNFTKPVTMFMAENEQKVDKLIVSRGYGEDEVERVLMRGVVQTLEKRFVDILVADKNYRVYFPQVFEQMCIPSTITDSKGVKIETKKGFIDLTTYRSGVDERGVDDLTDILSINDDVLVLARYKNNDFVAITVAAYGCVR